MKKIILGLTLLFTISTITSQAFAATMDSVEPDIEMAYDVLIKNVQSINFDNSFVYKDGRVESQLEGCLEIKDLYTEDDKQLLNRLKRFLNSRGRKVLNTQYHCINSRTGSVAIGFYATKNDVKIAWLDDGESTPGLFLLNSVRGDRITTKPDGTHYHFDIFTLIKKDGAY